MRADNRFRAVVIGVLLALWLPVLIVVVWWFASAGSGSVYFPPLSDIFGRFAEEWFGEGFTKHVVPSLVNFGIGVLVAIVLGIVFGVLLALLPRVEMVVDPFLQFLRAVPAVALIPILLIVAGTGDASKIALIAFAALWPVLLNTVDGIKAIHPELRQTTRVYGITRANVFWRVLLPGAFPQISVGIRLTLSIALVVMVASELYAATRGIGWFVLYAQQTFSTADMWSGILLLGVIGYLITVLYGLYEAWALRWRPKATRTP